MSQPNTTPPPTKLSDFIAEYWVLFFFGSFFLMTMTLPLLFADIHNLFYWFVFIVFALVFLLICAGVFFHQIHEEH